MATTTPEKRPDSLAERMIARYEAELAQAHPTTDAEVAHAGVVANLIDDWRRRRDAVALADDEARG